MAIRLRSKKLFVPAARSGKVVRPSQVELELSARATRLLIDIINTVSRIISSAVVDRCRKVRGGSALGALIHAIQWFDLHGERRMLNSQEFAFRILRSLSRVSLVDQVCGVMLVESHARFLKRIRHRAGHHVYGDGPGRIDGRIPGIDSVLVTVTDVKSELVCADEIRVGSVVECSIRIDP